MPGKSKHKKFKNSQGRQIRTGQTPAATPNKPPTVAGTSLASKPQFTSGRSSPSAARATAAQFAPDHFKYVGTELRIAGILSGVILVIIIALYFILQ